MTIPKALSISADPPFTPGGPSGWCKVHNVLRVNGKCFKCRSERDDEAGGSAKLKPPKPAPSTPKLSFLNQAQIRAEARGIPLYQAMSELDHEQPELLESHVSAAMRLAELEASLRRESAIAAGLARLSTAQRARLDAHAQRRAREQAEEQQRRRAAGDWNARRESKK